MEDQLGEDGLAHVEVEKSRCVFLSREGLQGCVFVRCFISELMGKPS